ALDGDAEDGVLGDGDVLVGDGLAVDDEVDAGGGGVGDLLDFADPELVAVLAGLEVPGVADVEGVVGGGRREGDVLGGAEAGEACEQGEGCESAEQTAHEGSLQSG